MLPEWACTPAQEAGAADVINSANEEVEVWRATMASSCPQAGMLSIPASGSEVRLWAELPTSDMSRDDIPEKSCGCFQNIQ